MLAPILSIFWIEKLRFTLYSLREASKVPKEDWQTPIPSSGKNFAWVLEQMLQHDKNFSFYLPLSLRLSSLLFFPNTGEWDVEKDIEAIRDRYTPPAFPTHFLEIQIQSAKDLDLSQVPAHALAIATEWKGLLVQIETKLEAISEREILKKRYFSLTGIHTISGAINRSTEYCHVLWHKYASSYFNQELNSN